MSVEIGNSVTSIGSSVFYRCCSLSSVTIPNSVTSIANNAFGECKSLDVVRVNDLWAWLDIDFGNEYANPLYYAGHLYLNDTDITTNLVIPNDAMRIKKYTFSNFSG